MCPRATGEKLITHNRQASHNYHLEKKFEAGLVLKGSEVKSCRDGKVQLVDAYASVDRGEMWLHKANIAEYKQGGPFFNHVPTRTRKMLLHKREIANIKALLETKGYTLIPVRMYFKDSRIKVEVALARGKTKGDKRETSKTRETDRDMRAAVRRSRKDED
jgi:SsrA-binding protein